MLAPVNFMLDEGEHIAIIGPNGGGKSCLVDLIIGKNLLSQGTLEYDFGPGTKPSAYGNITLLMFEDALGSVEKPYYFQQRFNSQDRDESPLMTEVLDPSVLNDPLIDTFQMRPLLEKRMVLLSSGEMRRFHLFKCLVNKPRVLIVDNPFIGLDAPMREQLGEFFQKLISQHNVQIIMVMSSLDDIPEYMTHVVYVDGMKVEAKQTRAEYLNSLGARNIGNFELLSTAPIADIEKLPTQPVANLTADGSETDEIISIRNLSLPLPDSDRVLYGGLNWTVRRGEKWSLQGRNGSGKSTLLSLVCADHPAAYACDISLFGRRRGTGESIWEIKKHIGFVSPEFHRAYKEDRPAIDIVASGLHDSVGLYKRPRPDQIDTCLFWMRIFGIEQLRDRRFLTLSAGEQRMCLLARAFVKDPALLILDEPLHGLDTTRRELVREVIATFAQRPDKTLIMVTHYPEELPNIITHNLTL